MEPTLARVDEVPNQPLDWARLGQLDSVRRAGHLVEALQERGTE